MSFKQASKFCRRVGLTAHRTRFGLCHGYLTTSRMPNMKYYQPSALTAALSNPSSLLQVQHVVLGPVHYLPPTPDNIFVQQVANPWDPSDTLNTLNAMDHIKSVTIDLFHIMGYKNTTDIPSYHNAQTSPKCVLEALGHECEEIALCTWRLPNMPKVLITHLATSSALDACHPYRYDKLGWKSFVQANLQSPQYAAFDYTAEFHSRDLCGPEKGGVDYGDEEYLELLPIGKGYQYPFGFSSVQFAQDMIQNEIYFTRNPQSWKPDLYEQLRHRDGGVSSSLQY
ncbi:MAG: hypothetical protein Q9195_007196 [Heterodermia aff. obscurata]